ncbi:MAG: HIT family protein [Acidimicrobiaceae bacterium]|nr:HIT family protein [Acidimicrobiaceae bacterium]
MPTIFTRIIDGEIPARFVYKDHECAAFLDVRPLARGHCLVVPRNEIDQWTDLGASEAAHLTEVAHAIGNVQMRLLEPKRIGLVIAGFEVPHAHVHVVPLDSMANLDFALADASPEPQDLDWLRARIAEGLAADGHDGAAT